MLAPKFYWIQPPFLHGGGSRFKRSSLAACALSCSKDPLCATGTFIRSGSHKGECWLSSTLREARKSCFEPCESFRKLPSAAVATTSSPARAWYDMFHTR